MNRKLYASLLAALVCLAFGFLTGCSSSSSTPPPPTIAITTTGGTPQTQTVGEAFPTGLAVNVTSNGAAASGVTVTFAPPSSGASCTPSATTATTDSNGNASITCTANTTAGAYSVTASASSASATFSLTNQAPSVFVFDVNGLETDFNNDNCFCYYGIAGAVAFDLSGNVLGGAQDFNDGDGITSPTGGDTISATGSSLTVDTTTATGTLVLVTSNADVGVSGTETFTVQFANMNHALITQFDGTATSSGSMDLQTNTAPSGNFAFTLSGTDSSYDEVSYGGVFSDTSGAITGTVDVNDDGTPTPAPEAGNMTGTDNGTGGSAYGRGTASVTINGTTTLSLVYYIVGPEVIRIIDMDPGDTSGAGSAAVGSAYGQGTTTSFDSTALGTTDVFGFNGNSWGELYAAAGNILPVGTAGVATGTFTGEADLDDEGDIATASAPSLVGTYTIESNGYGSMSVTSENLGNVTTLGVYVTDPTLNLYDPNNTTTGQGGALVMEMDGALDAGIGIATPQAATTAATDLNNSYGFGAQAYGDGSEGWEYDFLGQGAFSTLALTGTGNISDPFSFFADETPAVYTGVAFAGTATGPDANGRYTVPLGVGPVVSGGSVDTFNYVMYEANSGFVFWIDEDDSFLSASLGSLEMQNESALKAMHVKRGTRVKGMKKTQR
jgi:hypothetical protein